jgi:Protein of unknown function (DUF1569)
MHAVFEGVVRRFSRELDGLDLDTSQKHPLDKDYLWGIQEIVEHLVLNYRVNAKELETRLLKGRVSRRQWRSPVQWVLQLMVLSFGYMPRGVPAMEGTTPVAGSMPAMDGHELLALLRNELDAMDELLTRCRGQYGMERVATHPILGPMRVDQWRRFHVVHMLHHLEQLLRVKSQVAPNTHRGEVFDAPLAKKLRIPAHRSIT